MYSTHSTHSTHLEGTAEVAGAGKDPHAEPLAERLRLAIAAEEGENGGSHKHACADGEADGDVCAGGGGVVQASGYPDADAAGPEETPGQQNRTPAARQRKWGEGERKGGRGSGREGWCAATVCGAGEAVCDAMPRSSNEIVGLKIRLPGSCGLYRVWRTWTPGRTLTCTEFQNSGWHAWVACMTQALWADVGRRSPRLVTK